MAAFAKMAAVGIGSALVAYLFDPDRGKGRRARMADQTKARIRRLRDAARRQMEYQSNRIQGLAHELKPDGPPLDLTDDLLRQKVKSEVIGPAQLPNVEVEVRNRVVTLVGEIEDVQYQYLAKQIRRIAGVESVDRAQIPHVSATGPDRG